MLARGMGRCCVSGCGDLVLDEINKTITTREGIILHEAVRTSPIPSAPNSRAMVASFGVSALHLIFKRLV